MTTPVRSVRARASVAVLQHARRRAGSSPELWACLLLAFLALAAAGTAHAARAAGAAQAAPSQSALGEPTEYGVKAVFLQRFATPYVKWPETAFASKTAPFVVQILGKDPFGKQLDELLAGKKVGDHPIELVRRASVDELEPCHLLFVPQSQEKQLEKLKLALGDKPVLVVAESIAAAQGGAQIGFYLEKSRVRFAINPGAAKRSKLEISSELLKLAKLVEDKAEGDR